MASKYWIKLYHEILHDPKMGMLPDNVWRRAIELFLLAGELDEDGKLPETEEIAWLLRQPSSEGLEAELAHLERVKILTRLPDGWLVTKFAERQAAIDSTERSRMSRQRNKDKTNLQRNVADSETEDKKEGQERATWMAKIYRELPTSPGVYKISCSGSGRFYIGASINLQGRVQSHLSEMSATPHHKMSEDFKKYGETSISVEVLEHLSDSGKLKDREGYWINQYPIDGLYNAEAAGKRHRSWNDENNATLRCTDKDTDTESLPKGNSGKKPQPPPKKESRGPKTLVKEAFLEASKLPWPGLKNDQDFWWGQLGEITRIFDSDPDKAVKAIKSIIDYMREEGLSIVSPKSVIGFCRQVAGGQPLSNGRDSPQFQHNGGGKVEIKTTSTTDGGFNL